MIVGVLILGYLLFAMISFLATASERKAPLYVSMGVGLVTWGVHGFALVRRGIEAGRWPFTNTYETLILLSFLVMSIYFLTFRRYRMVVVGGFSGLIISVILALTSLLSSEIEPLVPSLKSNWLLFHVVSSFIGYSSFALASASSAVYLCVTILPAKFHRAEGESVKTDEMLRYLDWLTYRMISLGFPFLTLGIATGAVWANASWGRYWNWDPKETWAFITWLVFAVSLHMRYDKRCQGRPVAWVTLLGFGTVMFTYFGVNFWLSSLHAYG